MTTDDAEWLTRPDLPAGLERWRLTLPAGERRSTSAADWAGALVRIEEGVLEVVCRSGGHESFDAGDLLALGWLPIVELRNRGDGPVRLVAVRRRGDVPTASGLRVR